MHSITMALNMMILLGTALLPGLIHAKTVADDKGPLQMAENVADRIYMNKDTFFKWAYTGAIVFDGLYICDEILHMNYSQIMGSYLDKWITDQSSYGYKVLHKMQIPWGNAVGDSLSLFPINYLNRLITTPMPVKTFNFTAYREVAELVSYSYILKWPYRLPDGTFSRHTGWAGQKDENASFLWADDQYMGLTLLARNSVFDAESPYAKLVGEMALKYAKYLQDPQDGLYYHGYNHATKEHSCCKWGRGNGWGMMANVEVLGAVGAYPFLANISIYRDLLKVFKEHTMAMIRHQGIDGRWHQVVDDKNTYLETSVTSMTLYAMIRGMLEGFLPQSPEIHQAIKKAWRGLQETVKDNGEVTGICMGTPILSSSAEYNKQPTEYMLSGPGIGSVLYAASYMQLYLNHFQEHVQMDGNMWDKL